MDLDENSHGRRVWSLAPTSLKVKVKDQGHHGQKTAFLALLAACMQFFLVKHGDLASSLRFFLDRGLLFRKSTNPNHNHNHNLRNSGPVPFCGLDILVSPEVLISTTRLSHPFFIHSGLLMERLLLSLCQLSGSLPILFQFHLNLLHSSKSF